MEKKLKALENRIGYEFRNRNLLILALTHSSYANEKKLGKVGCNERLEFLGDAVLELISSDFLYKKYTQIPEGELTKKRASLVCEPSLAYCARDFGLPQYLLLGKGEDMTGGRNRDSIVSDATEAKLRGFLVSVPEKITSCMFPPRSCLALCSPRTQRTASPTLLFPLPFGPTIPVIPL